MFSKSIVAYGGCNFSSENVYLGTDFIYLLQDEDYFGTEIMSVPFYDN